MDIEIQKMCSPIRVVVADDHPVIIMGIRKILEIEADMDVVATACSLDDLDEILISHQIDVLICDYTFESDVGRDGTRLIGRIRRNYPDIRILVLSVHDELIVVRRLIAAGVGGFLSKASSALSALAGAVRKIHQGEAYIDPVIATALSIEYLRLLTKRGNPRATELSKREYEVVRLLSLGMTVGVIACHTGRSVKTISAQKVSAMRKLAARNEAELVVRFRELEM
ncbi:response regulator transcription factor (plasmid) [Paraburkholderia acidicola]|uniref:Response regulator transcription factor n=1 Tax=Paraburkholderia acidicola TaxID=1912599 RepID=A0ABV1M0V8_9BURK